MSKIVIVNDKDEVLGYKERNDRDTSDIIRVSTLWIFNDKKEILIAQRMHTKIHDPNKWGPSVAGTVEEGETYASNAVKEAQEEVGLIIHKKDLILGQHGFVTTNYRFFYQSFFVRTNLPLSAFTVQKEEVAQLRWITADELLQWIHNKPEDFIESFRRKDASFYSFVEYLNIIYDK